MLIAIYVMFSLPYRRGTGFSLLIMVWTMCSSFLLLSRFSFRPTNLVSGFCFVFVPFSFFYSHLIVSLFLLVKPDLTSHKTKIKRIDKSSRIFIYTWLHMTTHDYTWHTSKVFWMVILQAVSLLQRHNNAAILRTSRKSSKMINSPDISHFKRWPPLSFV